MSARPWRLERARADVRAHGWSFLSTFGTAERGAEDVQTYWRSWDGGKYEYRLRNRDTGEVVPVDAESSPEEKA